ncbi:MAG: hypothetical protein ACUVXA_10790 [Candidatus Jordarchaeum sp.]|uniref:hypothetical protein n=1 Tax=Candidatus Jordarchaeum sp. TaxID=2823881 RepID=UPI00404B161E
MRNPTPPQLGKPRRKNKARRRGTHIRLLEPGEFKIEEEEEKPRRQKPRGAKCGEVFKNVREDTPNLSVQKTFTPQNF